MKRAFSYIGFSSFLLFFSVMFIPFFYMSTGKEYDYNQQVSRGFISREAVFFNIETGETEPDYQVHIEYNTGEVFDFGTYSQSELDGLTSPEEMEEYIASITPPPEAVQTFPNTRDASGLSVVERLLTAGTGDYLAAVHDGDTRYVLIGGEPTLPPVVSGRFFTPSECLSSEKLAVIGRNYMDDIYVANGSPSRWARRQVLGTWLPKVSMQWFRLKAWFGWHPRHCKHSRQLPPLSRMAGTWERWRPVASTQRVCVGCLRQQQHRSPPSLRWARRSA